MSTGSSDLFAEAQSRYQAGALADAADLFQQVLSRDPTHPDALHMLGVVAYQLGQVDAAAALLEQAITVRQPFAEAESNFGTVLMALGRLPEAEDVLRRAHDNAPDNPAILFNLGNACLERGKQDDALEAYARTVEMKPDHAEAWCQLGIIHRNAGRIAEAIAAYETATDVNPGFSQALYNLANVYRDTDRFGDGERTLRKAIDVRPDYAMAWNSLGTLLGDMGRSDEAVDAFDQAVLFAPDSGPYASNRLCALQYTSDITDQQLAEAHTEWYWLHVAPYIEADPAPRSDTDPNRTLKVGFVSPDFGLHPVGFLSAPLFEHLSSDDVETFVFSTRPEALDDTLSKRIQSACDHWVCSESDTDADLADRIEQARIDILFDMSGQTSGNQLTAFARKPAPIQISWIGYVGTTGLPTMDYVLTDWTQSPEGSDATYTESALRLADGYVCYAPPAYAPDIAPLPAAKNGYVTFGCLNNPGKLNQTVLEMYAEILLAVPDSRLLFRFRGMDDPAVHIPIQRVFDERGIARERITFEGRASHADFLDTYNRIDIALDTFPYSGGLTTCEALWMGVPTVTFPGATFAGRHAATHLCTAGYSDMVVASRKDVVARVVELTGDLDTLSNVRQEMRTQVKASPLCDGLRFAKSFSAAIRSAWQNRCATASVKDS